MQALKHNILTNTDSYKVSMHSQYPEGAEGLFSYIESRGGVHDELVFFGLQAFSKEYLVGVFTEEQAEEAIAVWKAHGMNVNEEGIRKLIGRPIPVKIRAVPEGLAIPVKNVLATIEVTDPEFLWIVTFLETALLRAIWYPTTVASNSREIKKIIKYYLEETGTPESLPFKLHDFGARGCSSYETSALGGMAHLVNFMGTDTIAGVVSAMKYYGADVCGYSIPASEHSISTAWGRDNEAGYVRNMIKISKDQKIFANVADTYDVYNFVKMLGTELKDEIVALGDEGRTMVVRPDSGDPVIVPVKVIQSLMDYFGYEINEKGYKVLPPYIRVIQGDGIDGEMVDTILARMERKGLSADNIAFGMGGKLLGAPQRDDQQFAMKASAIKINGEWIPIAKDPVTDPGKVSKKGRLTLTHLNDGFRTVTVNEGEHPFGEIMRDVFVDGVLVKEMNFDEVRTNAELY